MMSGTIIIITGRPAGSKISPEHFGFAKASTSPAAQSTLAPLSDDSCFSQSKRRRYNVKWGEGHEWLKYSETEGAMFCGLLRG